MSYIKLVRDNIPDVIIASGQTPITRVLSDKEYIDELFKKLGEEYEEFLEARNLEELADMLEVIYALADTISSRELLERARKEKLKDRGGFTRKLYLEGVDN